MGRRNGHEAQDIALHHMEKLNRRNENNNNEKTLKEQLDYANLSPEERRKRLPSGEWYRNLKDVALGPKNTVGNRLYTWVTSKFKKEIEEMRTSGESYENVVRFIKSKNLDLLNI